MANEDLQKKYESLPGELKRALFDPEIANRIYKIGESFNIPKEKMETLAQITGKVFLKIIDLDYLKDALKDDLEISLVDAEKLCQKLNKEVFSPYKKYLKETKEETIGQTQQMNDQKQEKIKTKKELSSKEENDKYREPINDEEDIINPQVIVKDNDGRIKKIL